MRSRSITSGHILIAALLALAGMFVAAGPAFAADGDGITYEPASSQYYYDGSFRLEEGVHGYTENGVFYYDDLIKYEGNKLIVQEDGVKTTYTYEGNGYYDKNDKELDESIEYNWKSQQKDEPWKLDNTYTITIQYGKWKTTVDARIIPNSVKSVSFKPSDSGEKRFSVFEYTNGSVQKDEDGDEFWRYSCPKLEKGDTLTLTKKDGTKVTYKYANGDDDEVFIKEDGEKSDRDYYLRDWDLDDSAFRTADKELEAANPPGKTHDKLFKIRAHGCTATYGFTVKSYSSIYTAKADAKTRLKEYYDDLLDKDYSDAGKEKLKEYYDDGISAIADAETKFAAGKAYLTAEEKMGNIKTNYGEEEDDSNIANASVTVASAAYTGKELKPAVTVKTAGGAELTAGINYSVKYEDNIEPGKGRVTVTGEDGFTGEKTVYFTIYKAD